MEIYYSVLLLVLAFWLGACPFSVVIGRWLLGKDITAYGDGNPGAANVFRAGGIKPGLLAMFLDVAKGIPLVMVAHSLFNLPPMVVLAVGLTAILGHAFSPILRLKGGKSIAVTFGVLLALPQHDIVLMFSIFIFCGFLFIDSDAWTVMLGPAGTLVYLMTSRGSSWESLFMLCVLVLFAIKQYANLQALPKFRVKPINWLQSRKRENLT